MTHPSATVHPAGSMMNRAAMTFLRVTPQAIPADGAPVTHQADGYGGSTATTLPGDGLRAYVQGTRGISLDRAADILASAASTATAAWEFNDRHLPSALPPIVAEENPQCKNFSEVAYFREVPVRIE